MLVVSALLAFNALLLWVATGPRSLEAITPYMEDALSSSDGSYHVKIGKTQLIWDGWKHPVDIRLKDITVLTNEEKVFTTFPEIALGVDILYLPLGKIMPTSLTITAPIINIIQNDDRSLGFGFKQQNTETVKTTQTVPFSALLAPFLQNDEGNFRRLRSVIINNAGLNFVNSKEIVFFDARNLNIKLNRNKQGKIKIDSSASIYYNDYTSNIRAQFSLQPDQTIAEGTLEFSELMPNVLAGLFYNDADLKSFAVPVSGKANILLDMNGNIKNLGFSIQGGKGNIESERFNTPIPINSLSLAGRISDNLYQLEITKLDVDIEGVTIATKAMVNFHDTSIEPDATPEIKAALILKNAASDKVNMLWPPALSPLTREWVTTSISGGKIQEANLVININKGDLNKPSLPKEAVNANIKVEDLNILYLPEHPPVNNVKGEIHIDGVGLDAAIDSASFLEKTKLSNGHVLIENLNAENPYIKVDLQAEASAKDMVHFLGLPRLRHKEHLGLREDEVKGDVKGEAKVGFNFFAPKGKKAEDAIIYDVKAEVIGITQNGFLKKFDVVNVNGTVGVNNNGVEFTGTGEINSAQVSKGNVKYLFSPEKGFDTFIEGSTKANAQVMKRFGYPEFAFMKGGSIGVNAKVKLGDNIEQTEATLDLADADIYLDIIGWKKPIKEAAIIDLISEKKDGIIKISSFNLNGNNISSKGSAILSGDFSGFSNIDLSKLDFGDNDISDLHYENNANGIVFQIAAKSADATSWLASSADGFSFKNFPATYFKGNIGKLTLAKNKILYGINGELSCGKYTCSNINLNGTTGAEKAFSIKLSKDAKNQREIAIKSDDAGSFLYATGVLDGMNGGELRINGTYKEDREGSTLTGKLLVSEHTIKNAPLLGKVLSLASLTGLIDTLQGNGIRFKELNIPFTLNNDVITIEKGKTYGSAIGLTVDGTITFPKKYLDLQGTVVPSYSLNSIFGKVPLLGEMLTGGEGQGVFAARYSIRGVEDKADVSVNPLSILTPGFLRGLFDIFDDKPAKKTKNNQ